MKKVTLSILVICLSLIATLEASAQKPIGTTTAKSTTSYATTQQVASLENSVAILTKKVDAIQARYEEVLAENNNLKEKLGPRVPLASSEKDGLRFEAVKAYRVGNDVIVEVLMTNLTNEDMDLKYFTKWIVITDEFGDLTKEMEIINKTDMYPNLNQLPMEKGYKDRIFPNASLKINIKAKGFSSISSIVGSLGFKDEFYVNGIEWFSPSLLNIKIN